MYVHLKKCDWETFKLEQLNDQQLINLLQKKGLKKTKLRMALLQHFSKVTIAQSYDDLSHSLEISADKSTLYRNLHAFEEAGILHSINDHSGVSKYAFGGDTSHGDEQHAHFVCEKCETVYCLGNIDSLQLNVPEGFETVRVQTVVRGKCANC